MSNQQGTTGNNEVMPLSFNGIELNPVMRSNITGNTKKCWIFVMPNQSEEI